jgi:hypothetical protein
VCGVRADALKIHVLPLEGQELVLAHTSAEGEDVESFEPLASHGLQKPAGLLLCQRVYLFADDPGELQAGRGVARDEAIGNARWTFERFRKHANSEVRSLYPKFMVPLVRALEATDREQDRLFFAWVGWDPPNDA